MCHCSPYMPQTKKGAAPLLFLLMSEYVGQLKLYFLKLLLDYQLQLL